jgi:hypothetical protein
VASAAHRAATTARSHCASGRVEAVLVGVESALLLTRRR